MSKLDLSNVIRVTLLSALRGLQNVNTSALAIFTDEVPIPADFGTARIYLNPTGVAEDFGSNSDAYAYALAIFNQTPNIISGGGYLVVIPRLAAAAAASATLLGDTPINLLDLTATDYNINVNVDGGGAADLAIGEVDTSSVLAAQTSLNSTAVTAAGLEFVLSGSDVASVVVTLKTTGTGAAKTLVLGDASTGTDIAGLLGLAKAVTVSGADAGTERVKDAILRTSGAVDYFGIVLNEKLSDAVLTETAALVQSYDKLMFVGSNLTADIAGIFTTLKNAGYTHTRCLYYSSSEADALEFAAGYAGRGLCINFDGINTAMTMELKEIVGFVADPGMSQTIANAAAAAGVDVYVDYGVPKMKTSGANEFFDFIYMSIAFKVRLQIAGFNFLATTNTKYPQTEEGMTGLKGAYRTVCKAFVTNGSFAPGTWNNATKFGNPEDHVRNIAEFGYYIYSMPIADQSQTVREARSAPAIQIAGKSAGAIHSSDVVAFLEK